MSETSDRPSPGVLDLVVRAAFVPDGAQVPPEFTSDINPLKIRARLDPETGEITCDGAGSDFHGDIRARWQPDADQGSGGEEEGA